MRRPKPTLSMVQQAVESALVEGVKDIDQLAAIAYGDSDVPQGERRAVVACLLHAGIAA